MYMPNAHRSQKRELYLLKLDIQIVVDAGNWLSLGPQERTVVNLIAEHLSVPILVISHIYFDHETKVKVFCLLVFQDRVLCGSGCPRCSSVDHAGLELGDLPALAFEFWHWKCVPFSIFWFCISCFFYCHVLSTFKLKGFLVFLFLFVFTW